MVHTDTDAIAKLKELSAGSGLDLSGGMIRRSSSRFCLGVEHGDYNGTELFGVGTDRYIWLAFKPNESSSIRLFSGNFVNEGVIVFEAGRAPDPGSDIFGKSWARFPMGVDYILRREGMPLTRGMDMVIFGNIPGGGMSRSASLTLNLILSMLEASGIAPPDPLKIVDMAQAVENDYIGSPCGQLDQVMILFAREGQGTHYNPADRSIRYVPLGEQAPDFRLVSLDTGTLRPGLENSTYKIRRAECETLVDMASREFDISCLAEIRDDSVYSKIFDRFKDSHPDLCKRMRYIYSAQKRFYTLLDAWENGDIHTVGKVFREDGIGLRDDYRISGPELETMCDLARAVPGVLGERMLGGGDKGAAGAIVLSGSLETLEKTIRQGYPRSHPGYADCFAVHALRSVQGIMRLKGWQ
ncbi:MAG: hypothetical protein ABIK28_21895 [Planctomycetota bacterium]